MMGRLIEHTRRTATTVEIAFLYFVGIAATILLFPVLWMFGFELLPFMLYEDWDVRRKKPRQSKPPEPEPLAHLVGLVGKARSALSPAGVVLIEGRRYDARNIDGHFTAPDARVEVVETRGETVCVREADGGA